MRRLISLAALLASVFGGYQASQGTFGMLSGVIWVVAIVLGLCAAVMVVLDLPLRRPGPVQDSGFDSEGNLTPGAQAVGLFGMLGTACLFLVIAVRGLARGWMPVFGTGPDAALAERPAAFILSGLGWLGLASVFAGLAWLSYRSNRRARKRGSRRFH